MKNCVYCTSPEIKQRQIVENELAWAFPTNIPITPGHVLVVPKRCVERYEELTPEEKDAIEGLRLKLINALKSLYGVEGFHYAWNEAKVTRQSVPHFHLHIVPRKEGDDGITEYEPRKFLYRPGSREATSEEELRAVAEEIRNAI